jgi:arylsulfatase A-like enzyme
VSSWRGIPRVALAGFLSLFMIGAIEFLLKVDFSEAVPFSDLIQVTLIVGIGYGLLGALGSILIGSVFILKIRRPGGLQADYPLFLLWALVAFSYIGYAVNTGWLRGVPISDPLSIAVSLLILALCIGLFTLLHRIAGPRVHRILSGGYMAGILILALLSPCHAPAARATTLPSAAGTGDNETTGWNVLLITVDTLRPDHLGCYGHRGIRTPTIDSIAREGARFEDVLTSVPITLPSHASIMTGLYPPSHGIRFNGAYSLPDSIVTMAELLRDAGYTTGAVVGSYALDSIFGLDQGFETYNDNYPAGNVLKFKYPKLWPSLSRLLVTRIMARLLPMNFFFSEPQRRADQVTEAALDWLHKHSRERFFLWIHYFDPHTPYDPPTIPELGTPRTSVPDRTLITHKPPYRYWWGEVESLDEVYRRYDGEIEFTDYWLKRVMEELDRQGIRNHTLIVFTADHGECLWEHDLPGHGDSIFDSELRVPLIISLPAVLPTGLRIDQQVELVDILPTILDILGLPIPQQVQGISLKGLMDGKEAPGSRPAYCETLWPRDPGKRRKGIREGGWKYITGLSGDPQYLYNLADDPHELRDLSVERPDLVEAFNAQLESISGRMGGQEGPPPEMDETVKARLKALGYVR